MDGHTALFSLSVFHFSLVSSSSSSPSLFASARPQALTTSLERKGVLSKLKAELRAHVFEAVQQQGDLPESGRPFREIPQGKLLVGLVTEYLEWAGLDYARRVFVAEAGEEEAYSGRADLAGELGIDDSTHSGGGGGVKADKPLLCTVLERFTSASAASAGHSAGASQQRAGGVQVTAAYVGKPGLAPLGGGANRPTGGGGLAPLAPVGGAKSGAAPVSAAAGQRSQTSIVMSDSGDIEESIEIDDDVDIGDDSDLEISGSGHVGGVRGASVAAGGVSQSRLSMDLGDSLYGAEDRSGSIGDMEETVDFVESVDDSRRR